MTILDEIAGATRARVAAARARLPDAELARLAEALASQDPAPRRFEAALARDGISFICEVKQASPSKGVISEDFHPMVIAREYAAAGADAISVLTEPRWFGGADVYLSEISTVVAQPLLRKDFVVDPYMVDHAKLIGAQAVLLICSILDEATLARCVARAHELGMSALVEAYAEAEVPMALRAGARVVGVNNRDLRDFSVDIHRSERLRDQVPAEVLFVSESGIESAADVARLAAAGVDAVLIGESFMRAPDRAGLLASMREAGSR